MLNLLAALVLLAQETPAEPSFAKIYELFSRNCIGCHNPKESKGELNLESYEGLSKGGETGPAFVAGKPEESLLIQLVEQKTKPFMPPPKKGKKLSAADLALLRAWISSGAKGLRAGEVLPKVVAVPKIEPKVAPRKSIQSMAYEPKSKLLALARLGDVELRSAETRAVVRTLTGHSGPVNGVAFSADGTLLAAAGGEPGVAGEVRLWSVADGKLRKTFKGHADAVYSLALAPDGKTFATGSYDHSILLWDKDQDQPLREFHGHNEAVMSLAFRPDGKVLASASADRTVKLWDVATGERRETLGESTKALNAVVFSPDGGIVAAGGVDNRIRLWTVSADAKEGTNPLKSSSFAHEGAILKLAWSADGKSILSSADDRTVKLWNALDMSPRLVLEPQSDWPTALAFALDAKAVAVGRLDGGFQIYDATTGKVAMAPKPDLAALEPRGLQRGTTATLKLLGKNLAGELKSEDPSIKVRRIDESHAELTVPAERPPGEVELWLTGPGGDSTRAKVHVDVLPQVLETKGAVTTAALPVSFWGTLTARGDSDTFAFEGVQGQPLVVDAAAKRFGSKAELTLTLTDAAGRLVASNIEFEGEADPLLVTRLPADGRYLLTVTDLQLGASADHYYRLSVGDLAVVTGAFPLAVPATMETQVQLVGANLPPGATATVKAGKDGEAVVAVDPVRYRVRRAVKVLVSGLPEVTESGDNDRPEQAVRMSAPGGANGRINAPGDVDHYRFTSKAGQAWAIETQAAQRGSPTDTHIAVLHPDGRPVERVLLRAVRDSYLTFRPVDANAGGGRFWHWQEMDLGQYLYLQGEVVKLFLAPQGPDSEWKFFTQGGKRRCYFDTSATAHPLDEPAYIVEPHPPGTQLPPNGLPVFTLAYANDDDADRKLGTDSKLIFTAPADGDYVVRVRDTRGAGGDRYGYRLVVRESVPDFRVTLEGVNPNIPLGSGTSFTARADRVDGYEGPVRIDVAGLPDGFTASTPMVIEAGQLEAKGTLFAAPDATTPTAEQRAAIRVTAKAAPRGREVEKDVAGFGALAVQPRPKTVVWLQPDLEPGGDAASADPRKAKAVGSGGDGRAITVQPGGRVSALLKIQRFDHNDRVTFDLENLPFGVIVDDIGLNGILIPEGQSERRIFLLCAAWTPATERPAFARVREGPNPTSAPAVIRVPRR